jgi:hypothetical protein
MTAQRPSLGLCASCSHAKTVESDRGSKFLRCLLSDRDPAYAKYPRLPVIACNGWSPRDPEKAGTATGVYFR